MKTKKPSKEEQEAYDKGYSDGIADGFNEAARRAGVALGLLVPTPPEGAVPPDTTEDAVVAPPEEPQAPPGPLCSDCGHEKKSHEPLKSGGCYEPGGCKCRGYFEGKVKRFGRLKVRL